MHQGASVHISTRTVGALILVTVLPTKALSLERVTFVWRQSRGGVAVWLCGCVAVRMSCVQMPFRQEEVKIAPDAMLHFSPSLFQRDNGRRASEEAGVWEM